MPTPEEILAGLTKLTNDWWMLAVLWHFYFATVAVLVLRRAVAIRQMGLLMGVALLCVSALAWSIGNPFNGSMFIISAGALTALSTRLPMTPITLASGWRLVTGAVMFMFGWSYPHFLEASSPLAYLYAAPTGLIPCPTLSIIVGLTLIAGGLSRAWSLVLASLAAFYGVYGAFILGVKIDLVLAASAALLFSLALVSLPSSRFSQ
jgi:hypothetical protein